MKRVWFGAAMAPLVLAGGAASAATEHFTARLTGTSETLPTDAAGTGTVRASLDTATKAFSYAVSYYYLTGPVFAAGFHSGTTGVSGPVVLPLPKRALANPALTDPNPMKGEARLTDAQVKDLEAGQWYFNIYTAANPFGEVRGQVTETK
jgi:hypothetical protein